MKRATTLLSATILVAGCLLRSACAEPPPVAGPVYDFDWRLGGAAEVRPYQVFDDGQRVFLQFDDPKRVPAIFADTPSGLVLLRWRSDPPYVVVDRMEPALVFRSAGREARAVRTVPGGPPRMAQFGAARPSGEAPVTAPQQGGGAPARSINPPPDDR
ncbi:MULTISPECIES: TrbG/VirB9 family P-type conjugative transfer protein [Paraburkholderia]|uniref:TrbG/VirB9 family P-type conjugative transfer protein n=1 Tax=Paraburkholderia phytofirmans TaxID=261302 RepID=A0ABW9BGI2_9BURK|nr:TrbG/VirB9 family P-type conjugative transfer protein [Paraburkholderia sp. USG1]MDR8398461.1 TrbG/VirB9 family P-type conjugative transfer protein [Paraburkholderia sp. USG1]